MTARHFAEPRLFELFWENSKLNRTTIREFGERIAAYAPSPGDGPLLYPGSDRTLSTPNDPLFKLMRRRRSRREFSRKPVSERKLGSLFAAFAASHAGGRVFASAGATYALEVFALLLSVEGDLNRTTVHYNPDNHSLSILGPAPDPDDLGKLLYMDEQIGVPPVIFLFALFSSRTTAKYGERGGRFALIELGHAVQNLALRLAHENMAGVEAGGVPDDEIGRLLKLDPVKAKVAMAYACGYPLHASSFRHRSALGRNRERSLGSSPGT